MRDVRIRNSNRPTKIPASYHAFIYAWYGVDSLEYEVIIAADKVHADQLLRDLCLENGLSSAFFRFVSEVDFKICANGTDEYDILF